MKGGRQILIWVFFFLFGTLRPCYSVCVMWTRAECIGKGSVGFSAKRLATKRKFDWFYQTSTAEAYGLHKNSLLWNEFSSNGVEKRPSTNLLYIFSFFYLFIGLGAFFFLVRNCRSQPLTQNVVWQHKHFFNFRYVCLIIKHLP